MKDKRFSFKHPRQILGMGGPYVADLYENEYKIGESVLHENLLYDELEGRAFFVKYHSISKWANDNYFTLNFYCVIDMKHYQSEQQFDMLYLGHVAGNNIIVYSAFHDQIPGSAFELNLEDVDFTTI